MCRPEQSDFQRTRWLSNAIIQNCRAAAKVQIGKGSCNGSGSRTSNCRPLLPVTKWSSSTTHTSVTCLCRFNSHSGTQRIVLCKHCDNTLQMLLKHFQVHLFVMDFIKQGRSKVHTANTGGLRKKQIIYRISVTLSNNTDIPV
jgi:hypothetical protein